MFFLKWLIPLSFVSITSSAVFGLQIGVVDHDAILTSPSVQAMMRPVSIRVVKGQKELESLFKNFQVLKGEFDKNAMIMDDRTRQQKQGDLIKMQQRLQYKTEQLQREETVIQNQVRQTLQDACTKVAKEKDFDIVLSSRGLVMYASANFDTTKEVVKVLSKVTLDGKGDKQEVTPEVQTA